MDLAYQEKKENRDLEELPSRASQERTVIRDCQVCRVSKGFQGPKAL